MKMKKLLLTLILAVVSSSAMAEWVGVGRSVEAEGVTLYANPTTIRKSGNMVKMWRLIDYKTAKDAAGKQYMSTKRQDEYDCKEERLRIISLVAYSKNMGKGKVVGTADNKLYDWFPVTPDSLEEIIWEYACGK